MSSIYLLLSKSDVNSIFFYLYKVLEKICPALLTYSKWFPYPKLMVSLDVSVIAVIALPNTLT